MLCIVIPYYNQPEYLEPAIRSVLAQSDPEWRLIVVDNSADGKVVPEVLARYTDPRIRTLRNPSQLPMAESFNRCLEVADGEWVTILHSDDLLLPNYVAMMKEAIRSEPDATAFFCRALIIDEQGTETFSFVDRIKAYLEPKELKLQGEAGVSALLRGNFIMCPTLCFQKKRLGSNFSARWRFVMDLDFTTRLLMQGATLIGLNDLAYAYRRHSDAATTQLTAGTARFQEEIDFYRDIEGRLIPQSWRDAASIAHGLGVVRVHLALRSLLDLTTLKFAPAAAKLRLLAASWREPKPPRAQAQ